MATFNYILGDKKNDGRYPIYLKICNGKSNTKRSLDIYVVASDWKIKSQRISIRKSDDFDTRSDKEQSNDFLDNLMANAKNVEQKLKKRGCCGEMRNGKCKPQGKPKNECNTYRVWKPIK